MKKTLALLFILASIASTTYGMEERPVEVSIINSSGKSIYIRKTKGKFEEAEPLKSKMLHVKKGETVTIFASHMTKNLLADKKVPSFTTPKEIVTINEDLSVDINNL